MLEPRRFVDVLQTYARELRRSGRFRVVLELQRGLGSEELDALVSRLRAQPGQEHTTLPGSLTPWLQTCQAFRLQWQHMGADPPGHPGVGVAEVNLLALLDPEAGTAGGERTLDRLGEHGRVSLRWEGERPALRYHPPEAPEGVPLHTGLDGYFALLLERRALLGWQAELTSLEAQAALSRAAAQHLFPEGRVH